MRSERPSVTGWLLRRPVTLVFETALMAKDIAAGNIRAPGKSFYEKLILYTAITAFAVGGYGVSPYKLKYNHTESEQPGWYLIERMSDPTPNDLQLGQMYSLEYVCPKNKAGVCLFEDVKSTPEGVDLLKRVQGLPGHTIHQEFIDGKPVNVITGEGYHKRTGAILSTLKSGKEIPSILDATTPITIPDGFVYVGNQRVGHAFDSRYFGLVPITQINGKATKL